MSVKDLMNMLQFFGLTRLQAQIFIHLIRVGASSVSVISSALKTNRMSIYRNLKKLQNMGLVDVLPGRPLKFSAVPAAFALNVLLSAAKNRVLEMENMYTKILDEFSKLSAQHQEYTVETKFRFHCGRKNVYSVMMQMLGDSQREACLLTTPVDLVRLALSGFISILRRLNGRGVKVKILTNITDRRLASWLRDYMKYAVVRHSDINIVTRFLIVDDKAAFTSLSNDDSMKLESEGDSGFWTDSPHYIQSIKAFFEAIWRMAQDASVVLWRLETGKPMEKTVVFSDAENYQMYLIEMINRAKREVLICVSHLEELLTINELIETLEDAYARGVKLKVLASVNGETSDLKMLSEIAEVRHIDAKHTSIDFIITDAGECLLWFPISSMDNNRFQMIYLWSNSAIFSALLSKLFMDLWFKSLNLSIRLTEILFERAIGELFDVLSPMVTEKGWLPEMPATIRGKSGLNQNFDLALSIKDPVRSLVVGDFLRERDGIKMALISLYVKAIDVGATESFLIIPSSRWLSLEEYEMAKAYNIELIEGLKAEEICRKIIEKISGGA
ncbi:MAG: helix-turn-helix domain-containing protein [Candidatus Bathyarchaeia archaeon]